MLSLLSSDNCVSTHAITTPGKTYLHCSKKLCQKVTTSVLDFWDLPRWNTSQVEYWRACVLGTSRWLVTLLGLPWPYSYMNNIGKQMTKAQGLWRVRNAKRAACSAPWGRKERSASQTQHQGLLCCLSAEELLRVIMTWSDLPGPCVCVSLQGHTHSCYFLLRPPPAITEPASIRPTSPLICRMLGNKMTPCQQAIRTTINRLLGFEHMDFVLTVRAV